METRGNSRSVEISAKNVEQAIEKGLAEFGISREDAEITVIRAGSRGVLGIGAEDALVRISVLPAKSTEQARHEQVAPEPVMSEVAAPEAKPVEPVRTLPPVEAVEAPMAPAPEQKAAPVTPQTLRAPVAAKQALAPQDERAELVAASKEVLQTLLDHMGINARVEESDELSRLSEEETEEVVALNVSGDDLGILIGRRGETLRDLQFITRLIVSRKVQRWPNIVVDVEYYRARREKLLVDLAQRMAERVRQTHRPIALEPMPAHERRIVHLSLRDYPDVMTESTGEGQERKVVIMPKP